MNTASKKIQSTYWLTRVALVRGLGFVYFCAFFPLVHQYKALLGDNGLLPVGSYLSSVRHYFADAPLGQLFWKVPTLFWFGTADSMAMGLIYLGVALSVATMLGIANSFTFALLWLLQLSMVNVGQDFWGFGWESNLLELGFLAIFLVPFVRVSAYDAKCPPSPVLMFLYRWVLFRLMFGAGLIKLRGDACWLDLSCLQYHFETQPMPNPVSWLLHQLPAELLRAAVAVNHVVEVVVPFALFGTRRMRIAAGTIFVVFQLGIMAGGNYGWINAITLVMCIPCFDDQWLQRWFGFVFNLRKMRVAMTAMTPSPSRRLMTVLLLGLIGVLSYKPIVNLIGPHQLMNASYDRFHLVNSYGVFGSVTQERFEVILAGTDEEVVTEATIWKEYEFPCKPGDVKRTPCVAAPYHYRIGWQLWFAAMSSVQHNRWMIPLVGKLLAAAGDEGGQEVKALLSYDPFPELPPKFVKADLYRYRFTGWNGHEGSWYKREFVGPYYPPTQRGP